MSNAAGVGTGRKMGRPRISGFPSAKSLSIEPSAKEVKELYPEPALRATSYACNRKVNEKGKEYDAYCWGCFEPCSEKDIKHCQCSSCIRIYHQQCLGFSYNISNKDWICPECEQFNASREEYKKPGDRSRLQKCINTVLDLILRKKKVPIDMKFFTHQPEALKAVQNYYETYKMYIIYPISWDDVLEKTRDQIYSCPRDFYNDIAWMYHNHAIFPFPKTVKRKKIKNLLEYCYNHVIEMDMCPECYLNIIKKPNVKTQRRAFASNCSRNHPLAFGKVENFPLWPAKVMKTSRQNGVECVSMKFFGTLEFCPIPRSDITYVTSMEQLNITATDLLKREKEKVKKSTEKNLAESLEDARAYWAEKLSFDSADYEDHGESQVVSPLSGTSAEHANSVISTTSSTGSDIADLKKQVAVRRSSRKPSSESESKVQVKGPTAGVSTRSRESTPKSTNSLAKSLPVGGSKNDMTKTTRVIKETVNNVRVKETFTSISRSPAKATVPNAKVSTSQQASATKLINTAEKKPTKVASRQVGTKSGVPVFKSKAEFKIATEAFSLTKSRLNNGKSEQVLRNDTQVNDLAKEDSSLDVSEKLKERGAKLTKFAEETAKSKHVVQEETNERETFAKDNKKKLDIDETDGVMTLDGVDIDEVCKISDATIPLEMEKINESPKTDALSEAEEVNEQIEEEPKIVEVEEPDKGSEEGAKIDEVPKTVEEPHEEEKIDQVPKADEVAETENASIQEDSAECDGVASEEADIPEKTNDALGLESDQAASKVESEKDVIAEDEALKLDDESTGAFESSVVDEEENLSQEKVDEEQDLLQGEVSHTEKSLGSTETNESAIENSSAKEASLSGKECSDISENVAEDLNVSEPSSTCEIAEEPKLLITGSSTEPLEETTLNVNEDVVEKETEREESDDNILAQENMTTGTSSVSEEEAGNSPMRKTLVENEKRDDLNPALEEHAESSPVSKPLLEEERESSSFGSCEEALLTEDQAVESNTLQSNSEIVKDTESESAKSDGDNAELTEIASSNPEPAAKNATEPVTRKRYRGGMPNILISNETDPEILKDYDMEPANLPHSSGPRAEIIEPIERSDPYRESPESPVEEQLPLEDIPIDAINKNDEEQVNEGESFNGDIDDDSLICSERDYEPTDKNVGVESTDQRTEDVQENLNTDSEKINGGSSCAASENSEQANEPVNARFSEEGSENEDVGPGQHAFQLKGAPSLKFNEDTISQSSSTAHDNELVSSSPEIIKEVNSEKKTQPPSHLPVATDEEMELYLAAHNDVINRSNNNTPPTPPRKKRELSVIRLHGDPNKRVRLENIVNTIESSKQTDPMVRNVAVNNSKGILKSSISDSPFRTTSASQNLPASSRIIDARLNLPRSSSSSQASALNRHLFPSHSHSSITRRMVLPSNSANQVRQMLPTHSNNTTLSPINSKQFGNCSRASSGHVINAKNIVAPPSRAVDAPAMKEALSASPSFVSSLGKSNFQAGDEGTQPTNFGADSPVNRNVSNAGAATKPSVGNKNVRFSGYDYYMTLEKSAPDCTESDRRLTKTTCLALLEEIRDDVEKAYTNVALNSLDEFFQSLIQKINDNCDLIKNDIRTSASKRKLTDIPRNYYETIRDYPRNLQEMRFVERSVSLERKFKRSKEKHHVDCFNCHSTTVDDTFTYNATRDVHLYFCSYECRHSVSGFTRDRSRNGTASAHCSALSANSNGILHNAVNKTPIVSKMLESPSSIGRKPRLEGDELLSALRSCKKRSFERSSSSFRRNYHTGGHLYGQTRGGGNAGTVVNGQTRGAVLDSLVKQKFLDSQRRMMPQPAPAEANKG